MYFTHPYLKEIPLVRLLAFFIVGIIIGIHFENTIVAISSILFSIITLLIALSIRANYFAKHLKKQSFYVNLLLFCSILCSGYNLAALHYQLNHHSHYQHFINKKEVVKIHITSPISIQEKTVKIEGEIIEKIKEHSSILTKGKIIVYLEKDSNAIKLNYGDIIIAKGYLNEIDAPRNPNEFNYKKYLKFHNIYFNSYFDAKNWYVTSEKKSFWILKNIYNLRLYLTKIIDQYIIGEKEKAIANAILVGKKDLLDQETIRAYSSSGAMHVLAVSGLHVGIVYLVFNYALFFMEKTRLKKIKPILLIFLIWFYAFLTGASPSVLRAATMFSFIAIGQAMKHHVNIYNMIAASAFILILVNPYIITEVGFQLSYLAVIGIIYLQPKIYNLYISKNYFIDKVWGITAVSIAAQIATFPLGLLYFHQFPNFFWVSNLIVIPAAVFIVYLGVALFIFSAIHPLALLLGKVVSGIIWLLNQSVSFIDQLPYSLSSGIHISLFETYCIYIFIIFLALAIFHKNKIFLYFSLVSSLFFVFSYSGKYWQLNTEKTLTVYYVPNNSAFELKDAFTTYSYFDKNFLNNESQLLFRVKHHWWANHINQQNYITLTKGLHQINFADKSILVVDSAYQLPKKQINVDYAIIKHEPKIYLKYFSAKINAKKYIFDSSNKTYQLKYWEKDCEELNLDCYFVSKTKAFKEKLN